MSILEQLIRERELELDAIWVGGPGFKSEGDALEEKHRQQELAIERQNHELALAAEAARRTLHRLDHGDRDSRLLNYDDPRELEENRLK